MSSKSGNSEVSPDEPLDGTQVKRRALTGIVTIALREILIRFAGLLGNLVLARLLTPRDFGVIAFGNTLLVLGTTLSDGGIGAKLIQRAQPPSRRELETLQGFTLLMTMLLAAVIAAVGIPLGETGEIAAIMATSLPLSGIYAPNVVIAERSLRYQQVIRSDVTQVAAYNALAIVLVALGMGVWGMALALPVSNVLGAAVMIRPSTGGFVRPRLSFSLVREFLAFGLQMQASGLISTLRDQALNVLTAAIGGLAVLGIWSLANRILQGIILIFNSLWRVSFPAVARLIEAGEDPVPAVQRGLTVSTLITGFAVVAIGGTAPALVPFAFGAKWAPAVVVLPWVAGGLLVSGPISVAAISLLYGEGKAGVVLVSGVAIAIAYPAIAVPLLPSLGAEALGIGWLAGNAVDAAVLLHGLRNYELRVLRHNCVPAGAALIAGAVSWWIAKELGANLSGTLASLVAGQAVFIAVVGTLRRNALFDLMRLLSRAISEMGPRTDNSGST